MIKKIDKAACVSCRLCEHYCAGDIFRYENGEVFIAYREDCCNCKLCKRICPVDAIILNDAFPKKFDAAYRWRRVKEMLLS